jgi:hypothetical protein
MKVLYKWKGAANYLDTFRGITLERFSLNKLFTWLLAKGLGDLIGSRLQYSAFGFWVGRSTFYALGNLLSDLRVREDMDSPGKKEPNYNSNYKSHTPRRVLKISKCT